MRGIYLIENIENNKKYIGQAQDIKRRWNQHKTYYLQESHFATCPKLYAAFRKYGIDKFIFSVIEDCSDKEIDLTEREEYYIRLYDTVEKGYNSVYPTQVMRGEDNPNSKLSLTQVQEIKQLLKNTKLSQQEIAKKYNLSFSTVYRINKGEIWNDSALSYPIRTWNELGHFGESSGRSKLSDEEVLNIRKRYVNETPREIWEDYKDLYSLSGFSKICRGVTYTNVPIYNKTTKTWSSL